MNNIKQLGVSAWLDIQLHHDKINDSVYEKEMQRIFPFYNKMPYFEFLDKYGLSGYYTQDRLLPVALLHDKWKSKKQLRMGMVDFWLDHFNFYMPSVGTSLMKHYHFIRDNATGSFNEMLKQVYSSRVIHEYLTNTSNTKNGPNQNLARELLELHTIGVNNGYTQDDVIAVSRMISGAMVKDEGEMYYEPALHDTNPVKLSFGYSNPNNSTTPEGVLNQVHTLLDHLAKMPATAHHLAQKMIKRFVSDEPQPNLESKMVNVYLNRGTDVSLMIKTMFMSNEFKNSAGSKVRSLQNQLCSIMSMSNVTYDMSKIPMYSVEPANELTWERAFNSIHSPFNWITPDGYPSGNDYWGNIGAVQSSWLHVGETIYDLYGKSTVTGITKYNQVRYENIFSLNLNMTYKEAITQITQKMTGNTPNTNVMLALYRIWNNSSSSSNINDVIGSFNRLVYVAQGIAATPYL